MDRDWTLHIVSHTHWDREWYLSYQQYRRRFVKLMDRLLDLLSEREDYRSFTMDGQVLVVRDYLEIRPEREARVRELVRSGRLFIGPWYTQPNEFMCSGEAMIRNLMLGIRESRTLGGYMPVCYLPDAFGHISQLPQIMKGFGLHEAFLWRGVPRGAKTVFNWVGADGTHCLAFYIYPSYTNAKALSAREEDYTEVVDGTPFEREGLGRAVARLIGELEPKAEVPELLLLNGADHSFAQYDLPEVVRRLDEMPGLRARHGSLEEYVSAVCSRLPNRGPSQTFRGELRDPSESFILEGSQSTRAEVKAANRRIEDLFERWMEPFAAYAWLLGADYPAAEMRRAWEYLLQNHAHDSMACSSLDAVQRQVMTRFEWAEELGREIVDESLQRICNAAARGGDGKCFRMLAVFNPLGWSRSEVVSAVLDIPAALGIDAPRLMDGERELPLTVHSRRKAQVLRFNPRRGHPDGVTMDRFEISFAVEDIPANGLKMFSLLDGGDASAGAGAAPGGRVMENEYLRVLINDDGTLDLTDKRDGSLYAGLHFFEDIGEAGNGFEHKAPQKDRPVCSRGLKAEVSLVEAGPLRSVSRIDITMRLPRGLAPGRESRSEETVSCGISSRISLCAGSPRLDFDITVDNSVGDHLLRLVFPSGIDTDRSMAEQPFDVVGRGIAMPDPADYPVEKPSPMHPQLSFVDVSDGSRGLMAANHGLYEYEVKDDPERSIALTLLRCTDKLYGGDFAASEETQIPGAQCIGRHYFACSLIPHPGGWQEGYRQAQSFRHPLRAVLQHPLEEEVLPEHEDVMAYPVGTAGISFLEVEPDALLVSAVKRHEEHESLIVRLFNPTDKAIGGHLRLNRPGRCVEEAFAVDLKEENGVRLPLEDGRILVELHPRGLATVEVWFEDC